MEKVAITIEFDPARLETYTDEFLAQLWHICQANPAEFGDRAACGLVEKVKTEIARRWLGAAPVALYNHQASHIATRERLDWGIGGLVRGFVLECVVEDPDGVVAKADLFNAYREFCRTRSLPSDSAPFFLRRFVESLGGKIFHGKIADGQGRRVSAFAGIKLRDHSK